MILSDVEGYVRQDLFDPAGGSQRWATSDIDRAIDKAVDRYAAYYPNVAYSDMASQPFQRTYPYPTPVNASYPVMWIERVLYPLQVYGSYFLAPTSAPTLAKIAGSGMGTGVYQYLVTFISQGGETTVGPAASVTTTGGNNQVALTNIPLGPAAAASYANNTILGRNIYRTLVGGSTFYLLTTLVDNTTTTYTDVAADASISSMPTPPALNTSGLMIWPPRECNFSEYSNLFDSNLSPAAGGNLGVQGAVGTASSLLGTIGTGEPTFTLILQPANLPKDNTSILRVFYATKHQLDANGSTIPEIHRDIITLGACAYAMEAYQVPTNDNFDFQDGALRDRIDDSKIPVSWRQTAQDKQKQFIARLEEIKQQRDFAASSVVHWGEVQRYNWRL